MNFRKLITYLTMGTAAAMPLAVAQNPTILQGSYISNVFGNSNFIKNPNAQTNIADVTVSNATVTRSTTTPLVATSEFLVTTSTATGSATWSTRTFDSGMKGQNCEARFSYRGFSVGSTTAQILQGANVVAQLTLTASTDPRIASINFPCGDLSSATTFRLQQATASLTGTNEIGGIYVGLATNMANVAQAEMYGGIEYSGGATNTWNITQTTYASDFAASGSNGTAFGKCTAPATAVPQLICNNMPSGEYQVVWPIFLEGGFSNNLSTCRVVEASTGAVVQEVSTGSFNTGTNAYTGRPVVITGNVSFSSAGSRTFKLQCKATAGNAVALRFADQNNAKTVIYRFPSSSELVVTPERQNVFGGAKWNGTVAFSRSTTAEITVSNATFATNRSLFGKAQFTGTANDVAITIPQMPAGSYKVQFVGNYLSAQRAATGTGDFGCSFTIKDGTNNVTGAAAQYGIQYSINAITSVTGVFTYTSVADRTFTAYLNATQPAATDCYVSAPAIIIQPLDQPSNSALYVQGPVLGSQTGAAIPAGYVGELKRTFTALTNISRSVYQDLQSLVLTPGVWMCSTQTRIARNGATVTSPFDFLGCIGGTSGASGCTISYLDSVIGTGKNSGISSTFDWLTTGTPSTQIRYTGSNLIFADGTTVASATGTIYHKVYLDGTAGTPQASGSLECTRLN